MTPGFVDIPPPYPPVADALPHAPPMVLLDTILRVSKDTATAAVTIRPDAVFADRRGVPAVVAVEYLAQAVGVMLGTQARFVGAKVTGGYVVGVPRLALHTERFSVGDRLTVTVRHVWGEAELWKFHGTVARGETCLAEGDVSILRFAPDPADLARLTNGADPGT